MYFFRVPESNVKQIEHVNNQNRQQESNIGNRKRTISLNKKDEQKHEPKIDLFHSVSSNVNHNIDLLSDDFVGGNTNNNNGSWGEFQFNQDLDSNHAKSPQSQKFNSALSQNFTLDVQFNTTNQNSSLSNQQQNNQLDHISFSTAPPQSNNPSKDSNDLDIFFSFSPKKQQIHQEVKPSSNNQTQPQSQLNNQIQPQSQSNNQTQPQSQSNTQTHVRSNSQQVQPQPQPRSNSQGQPQFQSNNQVQPNQNGIKKSADILSLYQSSQQQNINNAYTTNATNGFQSYVQQNQPNFGYGGFKPTNQIPPINQMGGYQQQQQQQPAPINSMPRQFGMGGYNQNTFPNTTNGTTGGYGYGGQSVSTSYPSQNRYNNLPYNNGYTSGQYIQPQQSYDPKSSNFNIQSLYNK